MRSILFRSLAVIGAGGLVLAGVLYVASTVDARPPEVLEIALTQPLADDPQRAVITTSLEIVFSEPVEAASATAALALEPEVDGAVSWSGSTMIFTPADPLELETSYSVRIGEGVRDAAGNEMTELPAAFDFETAGRPALVEADPSDGATDVPLEAPITLTFSTLMDTASVEGELRLRPAFPHQLRWSGELLEIVPTQPLRPGLEYEVSVQADAADAAGVALGEPISLAFRTVSPGLVADVLVPGDGIDGIAPTSPIAVIFDRPVDPASVSDDLLAISPEVAGTLEVAPLPGDPEAEDGSGRLLRFVPSGPLAPNTTFEVQLSAGMTSTTGGGLSGPSAWTFTTGAPLTAISNQVTFVTDRAGVANVWAMNPDGTGQRQLTTELRPVLDYAVAPDGSSLVVADGSRLVFQRADGSERRVLTDDGVLEFDPAFAPNGQAIAFARADAETGEGLGLWEWEIGGGDATPIELPQEPGEGPTPSGDEDGTTLRAPRYSPDGAALAFVDLAGAIAVLELPSEQLTRVPFDAAGPPTWLPGSGSLVVAGTRRAGATPEIELESPVGPLVPGDTDETFRLARSGTALNRTPFGIGSHVVAISAEGQLAYIDRGGSLWLTDLPNSAPGTPLLADERVVAAAFAPGEPAMAIVTGGEGERGSLELLDLDTGRRTSLAPDGSLPRWLP